MTKRFSNGQFKPTKHFPFLGVIFLISLFTLVLLGTSRRTEINLGFYKSTTTFLSPIVVEEIEDFKMSYEIQDPSNYIKIKVSHYWPELGGTNCGNFVNGECVSKMANGERWQEEVGHAIACPKELPFGTKIEIMDREWVCKDRGSKITKQGDVYWVDMLIPYSLVPYGEVVRGEII